MTTRAAPGLQYAKTSDGVNVAFLSVGNGSPIVFASNIFGDAHFYVDVPWLHVRGVTDGLTALGWQVVRYDVRGMGSSDRSSSDLSLEGRVKDLEAVVDRLGYDRFALAAVDIGAATAVAFAARHPSRVSRLVLTSPWISGAEMFDLPALRAAARMLSSELGEWSVFTNVLANVASLFDDAELGKQLAQSMRKAATPDGLAAYYRTSSRIDLAPLLPLIRVPTLVVHEPAFPFGSLDLCQQVAKNIAGAHLVEVQGKSIAGTMHEDHVHVIHEFLRHGAVTSRAPVATPAPPSVSALTPRETEVLRRLAAGLTNKQIAADLGISVATVERHLVNVYDKIGARRRVDATTYALRHGLVSSS